MSTEIKNLTEKQYPKWVEHIRALYGNGEASVFVLHGNVHDYVYSSFGFQTMRDFFYDWMQSNKSAREVYKADLRNGLMKLKSTNGVVAESSYQDRNEPLSMLTLLAQMHKVLHSGNPSLILMPYAGSFMAGQDVQQLNLEERALLASLHDWSLDPEVAKGMSMVFLMVESLTELPSTIVSNPRVACVEIPLPSENERLQVIKHVTDRSDNGVNKLALYTAGLKAIQIAGIMGYNRGSASLSDDQRKELIREILSSQHSNPQTLETRVEKYVSVTANMRENEIRSLLDAQRDKSENDDDVLNILLQRKRAIIEKECAGLLEFVDTKYGLESVGGNEEIKKELMAIAKLIRSGNTKLSPMGLLAVGPMGAGKTFVVKAFLKEAGLPGVALKNIRSKWVGSTEQNLEKVLSTVKAMGPVALIIDEADRSFGAGDGESDGGTNSRIIARMKEFMSDPDNRGRVLFIMMTNRPDKLDTDLKRPGRLDRKIPFFYPQTVAEAANVIDVLLKRYGVNFSVTNMPEVSRDELLKNVVAKYSNADYEAVVGLCANMIASGDIAVDAEATPVVAMELQALQQAFVDFIASQERQMIEYMELQAVREASRRSLVPARFHEYYEPGKMDEKLRMLKPLLR